MKDMFYNYDNFIDRKSYPNIDSNLDSSKILESNPNLELVFDAHGNEIGIRGKYDSSFTLYFTLNGNVFDSEISEITDECTASFQVYNYRHKLLFTKELSADNFLDNVLCVELTNEDVQKIGRGLRYMRVSLSYATGADSYLLFNEQNGFLSIV